MHTKPLKAHVILTFDVYMTLIFNMVHIEIIKHVRAKFYQVKCGGL